MVTPKRSGRGRPKTLPSQASVKFAIDRTDIETAEGLVAAFDRVSPLAMRHTRIDVLRASIKRGLESLRAELAQQQKA